MNANVHLKIDVTGSHFAVYVNGATTPATTLDVDEFQTGKIALYSFSGQSFSNVRLFKSLFQPADANAPANEDSLTFQKVILNGGDGNDLLVARGDNSVLNDTSGDNSFEIGVDHGYEVSGAGTDALRVVGDDFDNDIVLKQSGDLINITGDVVAAITGVGNLRVEGRGGKDHLDASEMDAPTLLDGGIGADTVIGGTSVETQSYHDELPKQVMGHGGPFAPGQTGYADVDGDGKVDMIFQGVDNRFWLSLSTGDGFAPAQLVMGHGGPFAPGLTGYADVNAMAKADMIFQGVDTRFWLSLSTATASPRSW